MSDWTREQHEAARKACQDSEEACVNIFEELIMLRTDYTKLTGDDAACFQRDVLSCRESASLLPATLDHIAALEARIARAMAIPAHKTNTFPLSEAVRMRSDVLVEGFNIARDEFRAALTEDKTND